MGCGQSTPVHPAEKKQSKKETIEDENENEKQQNTKVSKNSTVALVSSRGQLDHDEKDIIGNRIPTILIEEQKRKQSQFAIEEENTDNKDKQNVTIPMGSPQSQKVQQKPDSVIEENNSPVKLKARHEKQGKNKLRGGEDNDDITENITKIKKSVKHEDLILIISTLKSHFVFFALSEDELEFIVNKMFYCEVRENQSIFNQGDKANSYFIIASGQVEIIIDNMVKQTLKNGDGFGQLALLYNAPRSAQVRARTKLCLWAIDRKTFRKSIEYIVEKDYQINRQFMESVTFFNSMTNEQKDVIALNLITVQYPKNTIIVNQGDRADSFYMIKEGVVSVTKGGQQIRQLNPGDSFGQQALYVSSTRGASVKAETEVQCLSLGRENLTQVLGDKVQMIIFNNIQRWAFSKSSTLGLLTQIQIEKIAQVIQVTNVKAGQVIFSQGENPQKLIIVLEGSMVMYQGDSTILVTDKGQIYGDQYLRQSQSADTIPDDFVMKTDGVISTVLFKNLEKIIGSDIEAAIQISEQSHEKKMAQLQDKADYSHIQLESLIYIKRLGFGQFGTVYLVMNPETQELYGLKSVSRYQIMEQNLEKHQIQEKAVLENANFPFIYHFFRTYRDTHSIYYLVEFINGMELFDVIREIGLLSTADSQYYIGSMILAIEYLHSRNIIYRDLKPENVMVNSNGVMQLIDMGTARMLQSQTRTFTIIGTPHYMAPQIIQGKGYSYSVDLWSIGVCLFQFMAGGVPYAEDKEDPYQIYEEIMKSNIQYPQGFQDQKAQQFIEQLLNQVPQLRLNGSFAALKAHTWFDNFDWDRLYNKELTPPYIPPPDQVMNIKEVTEIAKENQLVVDEIRAEQAQTKKEQTQIFTTQDPNWDQDF